MSIPIPSEFPDGELGDFIRAILLAVSKSIGVSYPTLSGDLSSVNYASIRQAVPLQKDRHGATLPCFSLQSWYSRYMRRFLWTCWGVAS